MSGSEQLDFLYDARTHRRSSDPATSHAAAASMESSAKVFCMRLLAAFKSAGPMTRTEAAKIAELTDYQCSKRISDLKNAGLIRDSGETRLGPSGRSQTVWEAAP